MQADNQQIHGKVNGQGCSPRAPLILLGDWSEMEKKTTLCIYEARALFFPSLPIFYSFSQASGLDGLANDQNDLTGRARV